MSRITVVLTVASMALASCSVVGKVNPWHRNNDVASLSVSTAPDVNYGYAVEVDVVFVLDDSAAAAIGQLTVQQWFVEGFKQRYESSRQVGIHHLEPMPGYAVDIEEFPRQYRKATKVYVFANYLNPRDMKPQEITRVAGAKLVFNRTSFVVENQP